MGAQETAAEGAKCNGRARQDPFGRSNPFGLSLSKPCPEPVEGLAAISLRSSKTVRAEHVEAPALSLIVGVEGRSQHHHPSALLRQAQEGPFDTLRANGGVMSRHDHLQAVLIARRQAIEHIQ